MKLKKGTDIRTLPVGKWQRPAYPDEFHITFIENAKGKVVVLPF